MKWTKYEIFFLCFGGKKYSLKLVEDSLEVPGEGSTLKFFLKDSHIVHVFKFDGLSIWAGKVEKMLVLLKPAFGDDFGIAQEGISAPKGKVIGMLLPEHMPYTAAWGNFHLTTAHPSFKRYFK